MRTITGDNYIVCILIFVTPNREYIIGQKFEIVN